MNRETREALEPLERAHLNSSFKWLGGGLAIITATAIGLHRSGASVRIMRANPWLVMGGRYVALRRVLPCCDGQTPGHRCSPGREPS